MIMAETRKKWSINRNSISMTRAASQLNLPTRHSNTTSSWKIRVSRTYRIRGGSTVATWAISWTRDMTTSNHRDMRQTSVIRRWLIALSNLHRMPKTDCTTLTTCFRVRHGKKMVIMYAMTDNRSLRAINIVKTSPERMHPPASPLSFLNRARTNHRREVDPWEKCSMSHTIKTATSRRTSSTKEKTLNSVTARCWNRNSISINCRAHEAWAAYWGKNNAR